MVDGGRPLEVLDSSPEQYRVVQHGVAIYFGSADKLSREHLKKLKRLVKRTNTPWLSDHLCWGSVDGRYTRVYRSPKSSFQTVGAWLVRGRENLWNLRADRCMRKCPQPR